ncbi:MAG: hypothetical protein LUE26_03870, partial [Alistipes sp.]|nr:hypothetical protein [Alistipes sp.]
VKRDMDQDRAKYEATCEKRKAAINKRWENENADEKTGIQMNTNVTDEYKRIQAYTSDTNTIQSNTIQSNIIRDADAPTPKRQKKFIPPTVEEVEAYCREKDYHIDAQQFVDFYETSGWMRQKTKIKDWRACVRTWVRRQNGQANQSGKPTGPQPEILTADNWED